MAIFRKDMDVMREVVISLRSLVDFEENLPSNVFKGGNYEYWFFERPLLAFSDLLASLVSASNKSYGSRVYIKYAGDRMVSGSLLEFDGFEVENAAEWIANGRPDFFDGDFEYPLMVFNKEFDWLAFEGFNEEFGVIAARKERCDSDFFSYLQSNFIPVSVFREWTKYSSVDGKIARVFLASYDRARS